MEEFIKALVQRLGPDVSAFLGVCALAVLIIPSMIKAWDSWKDTRSGRHASAAERARLELLKLRLEIEALKRQHHLELPVPFAPAVIVPTVPGIQVETTLAESSTLVSRPDKKRTVWRWLSAWDNRHHWLSIAALSILMALILPFAAMNALMVVVGLLTISGATTDIAFVALPAALEVLSLGILRALYRQYKLLNDARQEIPAHATTG